MRDTEPPASAGKVYWGFTMSLDGFVAGSGHDMGWMTGFTVRPSLIDGYVARTGAVLAGRDGRDAVVGNCRSWGGHVGSPRTLPACHNDESRRDNDSTGSPHGVVASGGPVLVCLSC